jgi:hypothetical protein
MDYYNRMTECILVMHIGVTWKLNRCKFFDIASNYTPARDCHISKFCMTSTDTSLPAVYLIPAWKLYYGKLVTKIAQLNSVRYRD